LAASKNLTPEQRKARASLAVSTMWANQPDRSARTAPARAGFRAKFERDIRAKHPDASDESVALMVDAAVRAHFTRMAFNSSKARAAKKNRNAAAITKTE
jgi:hypothetical protein